MRALKQLGEEPLSLLDRLPPQILAVQFEQIGRAKDCAPVCTMTADQLKDGKFGLSQTMASPSTRHEAYA